MTPLVRGTKPNDHIMPEIMAIIGSHQYSRLLYRFSTSWQLNYLMNHSLNSQNIATMSILTII